MQRRIQKLQTLITRQDQQLESLKQENGRLNSQITAKQTKFEQLQTSFQKYHPNDFNKILFTENRDPSNHNQLLKTLQSKIQVLNWQVLELQSLNTRYEDGIIAIKTDLLTKERQLTIYRTQNAQLNNRINIYQNSKKDQQNFIQQISKKWKQSANQKGKAISECQNLKNSIKQSKQKTNTVIMELKKENDQYKLKIQTISEIQQERLHEFGNTLEELRYENKRLQDSQAEKNKLLNLYLMTPEGQELSTRKINDVHTIRCLKQEIKKKSKIIEDLLKRAKQIEAALKKFQEFQSQYKSIKSQIKSVAQQNSALRGQNCDLTITLQSQRKKIEEFQANLSEEDKKVFELIVENQACHRLLYDIKGSKIYARDVSQKVQLIFKQIQNRRYNEEKWTDLKQLVNVNRRLKMHRCD